MAHSQPAQSLESRIRLLISCVARDRLPPVSTLSTMLNESRQSVLKALRVMRDEGELDFARGRGICVTGRSRAGVPAVGLRPPSSARLYEELKQRLVDGEYRAGDRLPKRDYYVLERHLSSHTVADAMRRLAADGLVHRRGKAWTAGKHPRMGVSPPGKPPVIVVVQNPKRRWRGYRNERTGKFLDRFSAEALRFGFTLQSFFVAPTDPGASQPFGSMEGLLAYIANLEHLYFGSLLLGHPAGYGDFGEVVRGLVFRKKPVVWLDSEGTPGAVEAAPRNFYHCRFSEEAMAEAAVRYLADHGHRTFCYIDIGLTDWSVRRKSHLARSAGRIGAITMLDFWDLYRPRSARDVPTTRRYLRKRYAEGPTALRRAIEFVAREYGHHAAPDSVPDREAMTAVARFFLDRPVMEEASYGRLRSVRELLTVFLDGRSTALVFTRDIAAKGNSAALAMAGIRVPDDVSLLSFDNLYGPAELKVDTVDNGADHLGYCAFHAIAGISIVKRSGADGAVIARPRVVDCGSVATLG